MPSIMKAALLIALLGGTCFAQEVPVPKAGFPETELLRQAEAEFQKGKEAASKPAEARKHFAAAAGHFDALRKRGVDNPDLYRNLGNAEMLAGNLAGAILSYRRGLRLSPNDRSLQANLEYVRGRVRYPTSSRPPELPWLPSASALLCLALALYALGCVGWTARLIKGRGTWRVAALFAGALLAGAAYAWLQWNDWQEERYPLVVIAGDGVPFYRGNGESYPPHPDVPTLNEGMETRRLFERGDWLYIQLPGGEVGWVKTDTVLLD